MRALPEPSEFVALHSNPGPEHVFVHASGGTLSGLIDFGDAYFSHTALDLRRFPDPADRAAIFAGYISESPVRDAFHRTWEVACVLTDMQTLTRAHFARDAIQSELAQLVQRLR